MPGKELRCSSVVLNSEIVFSENGIYGRVVGREFYYLGQFSYCVLLAVQLPIEDPQFPPRNPKAWINGNRFLQNWNCFFDLPVQG